jgi:Iron dependent repressor, N-terminal DNA binding domain
MAAERTAMRHVREELRLKTAGVSGNEIARRLNVAPSTVRLTLQRLAVAGLGWPLPAEMTAKEHRSTLVRHEFQLTHPCPSTGLTTGRCPGYVKDYIVPPACGGPDAVSNMQ